MTKVRKRPRKPHAPPTGGANLVLPRSQGRALRNETAPHGAPMVLSGGLPPDQNPAAVYLAGLSTGSRPTMRQALSSIAADLGERIDTMPWHLLRYQHTQAIRSKLASKYAPSTANKMLSALRGVLHEAKRLGLMTAEEYSNAVDIKSIRGERVTKGRAITASEIKKMFSVIDPQKMSGARDSAIFAVLLGAGLRRSEVVDLDLNSYDPVSRRLRVLGKGNKERSVPLPKGTYEALDHWLTFRGQEPGPLFPPIDRWGHFHLRRLNDKAIAFRLESIADRAGVKDVMPHDMRRTFITTLLELGIDLSTAQKLAGHEQISTTARYDKRDERAKEEAVKLLDIPFQRPGAQ